MGLWHRSKLEVLVLFTRDSRTLVTEQYLFEDLSRERKFQDALVCRSGPSSIFFLVLG